MRRAERKLRGVDGLLLAAAAVCGVLSAVCWSVLPGVRFSAKLFLVGAVCCVMLLCLNRWAERSAAGRRCRKVVFCLIAIGLAVFLTVEVMLIRAGEQQPTEDVTAVIVLGAGVNGTTPSLTLRTRITAAAEYLQEHPEVPAVLSGGQGPGEAITEAQAMYTALTALGVSPDRLWLEERSTSTEENIAFSLQILRDAGVDVSAPLGIVTNDFHQFRAGPIVQDNGADAVGIPAELPWWWLNANYYVREFFALGKLWLWSLFA